MPKVWHDRFTKIEGRGRLTLSSASCALSGMGLTHLVPTFRPAPELFRLTLANNGACYYLQELIGGSGQ